MLYRKITVIHRSIESFSSIMTALHYEVNYSRVIHVKRSSSNAHEKNREKPVALYELIMKDAFEGVEVAFSWDTMFYSVAGCVFWSS